MYTIIHIIEKTFVKMQHKGEIIEKVIRASGFPITKLAKKLGKSRKWVYLQFENSNVSIDHILEIGAIIHHDFSNDIKELKKYRILQEIQSAKQSETSYKSKLAEIEVWKNKYLELLEKYNHLLEITPTDKRKSSKIR